MTSDISGSDDEKMDPFEALKRNHRKEAKELRAKIQSLKSVAKSDKKKKKSIQEEIKKLESDMEEKHRNELKALEKKTDSTPEKISNSLSDMSINSNFSKFQNFKPSRQQRRKEKKQKEMEELRKQAELEAKNMPDLREHELSQLADKVSSDGLKIREITADGHCLYNAIGSQLDYAEDTPIHKKVRKMAAEFMRENQQDFIPFLTNNEGNPLDIDDFKQYCDKVENTAEWGGQLEIQAISRYLKKHIKIYQAQGPTLDIGEEFGGDPILLSYHIHAFGLGEHYNALEKSS